MDTKTSSSSTGKVLLGVLAGAAVGATLGVLYAPDRGTNTRRKIVEGANDKVCEIADKFNGYVERLSNGLETAKEGVNNLVENGKSKVEEAKQEATNQFDKNKGRVEDQSKKVAGNYNR